MSPMGGQPPMDVIMAQMGSPGKSGEEGGGEGSLEEEGFGLNCHEKEGASGAGGQQKRKHGKNVVLIRAGYVVTH